MPTFDGLAKSGSSPPLRRHSSLLITAAGSRFERVADAPPARGVEALFNADTVGVTSAANQAATNDLPGAWQAAGVLALYTAICVILAYWRSRTRDITSG